MKLLQLRFKNLNSLAGEWCIDFTDPVFTQEGIFAIVGPTGAGKSTLLDAICLAFYGRTPRLSSINSKSNELLSRHATDCFAEVTFACRTGLFRCHWSQRRARDRLDGNLQPQKHEFSCALSDTLLNSKEDSVNALVKKHVGMDFTQFTRTLLLAQGGFAAFLQADANERAPILEQITGTEIYSQISIVTHEKAREEREKLALLEAEAGGVSLLTEEKELFLSQHYEAIKAQDASLAILQTKNKSALGWLEKLKNLHAKLITLGQQEQLLRQKKEAFAPSAEKYELALKALDLSAFFASLELLRQEQKQEQEVQIAGQEKVPLLQKTILDSKNTHLLAAALSAEARQNLEKVQPLIIQVQALDSELQALKKSLQEKAADLDQKKNYIEAKQQEKKGAVAKAEEVKAKLQAERQRQERTCIDEALVSDFETIRARCRDSKKMWEELNLAQKRFLTVDAERQSTVKKHTETTAVRDTHLEKQQKLYAQLTINEVALQSVLHGRSIEVWRQERQSMDEQKKLLASYQKSWGRATSLREEIKQLEAETASVENILDALNQEYITLVQQRTVLEVEFTKLQRISSFEEERSRLVPDDACPLCGSKDHPFAASIPLVLTATEEALMAIRLLAVEQEKKIIEAKVHLATTQTSRAERSKQEKECMKECKRLQADILSLVRADIFISDGLFLISFDAVGVVQLHEHVEKLAVGAQNILATAENLYLEAGQIQAALKESSEELVAAEKESAKAQGLATSTDAKWIELKHETEVLKEDARLSLADLEDILARYNTGEVVANRLEAIESALKLRLLAWTGGQEVQKGFERFLSLHQETEAIREENIAQAMAEAEKLKTADLLAQQEYSRCHETRTRLFGTKSTAHEFTSLSGLVKSSETYAESTRLCYDRAEKEGNTLSAELRMLKKTIAERQQRLSHAEETFAALLVKAGFMDESAYQSAGLSDVYRKQYAEQTLALEREQAVIETGKQEGEKLLEEELAKKVTELLPEQVQVAIEETETAKARLREQMGALKQRLADAREARRQQEGLLLAIEAQKKEYAQWEQLNKLIGSHKGDKFRTFAQGLTFDVMIAHANIQLQKMTDRYLLARAADQPLVLTVTDAYMAGEERSTRNLSGGESFLVSLALALGLSSMISNTIQVDSLFLDEGFGSLDEETLETALETLAGLQQDNKLIGVISHVPSLKERIPLQIEVIPQHGGKSIIKGPGCSANLLVA